MESKDLVKVWAAPDNTKLTPRQMSIRLPVHVAAKLSALCELFPKRTRTEIIGDLLSTALGEVERELSPEAYSWEEEDEGPNESTPPDMRGLILGERRKYYRLVDKYEKELAAELSEEDETAGTSVRLPTPAPPTPAGAKRAPTAGGASAQATTKARPAAGGSGDKRSRKRTPAGGRRSREK